MQSYDCGMLQVVINAWQLSEVPSCEGGGEGEAVIGISNLGHIVTLIRC